MEFVLQIVVGRSIRENGSRDDDYCFNSDFLIIELESH